MLPELLYHIFSNTPIRIKGRIGLLKPLKLLIIMQVSFACSRRVDDLTHKKVKSSYGKCSSARGCRTNSAFGAVLAIMIVACLWIVQPFILGFAWAGTVVIATAGIVTFAKIMFGRRSLAVLVMTLLLVMVFIIPIALLVNSIVDGSGPLIKAISSGDMTLPDLAWLNTIPVIGAKLYAGWHNLLDMGTAIMAKVRPYIGTTTTVRWASGAYRALYGALCADASLQCPAVLAR